MARSDKKLRLRRLAKPDTGRIFICPMDHGFTVGPITGLYEMADTVSRIAGTGVDAIVVHKGIVGTIGNELATDTNMGLFVHLFGSTSASPDPNDKNVVCTVKHAMSVGAAPLSQPMPPPLPAQLDLMMLPRIVGLLAEQRMPPPLLSAIRPPVIVSPSKNEFASSPL